MSTLSIIILVAIGLLVLAAYGADYSEDTIRKYDPKRKRNGRTYKR
jgi:hypothetical protein